jgi:uncharacterized protein GlcG (DUF336 family)
MAALKLSQARLIIDGALQEARRLALAPVAVAVLDAGGQLVAFQREDRAGIARFEIANAKAWGALGLGFGTRELTERAETMPSFVASLGAITQGRMVPSPGGVLILADDQEVVGAVGVSGDTGDNDEACALAGIAAVGLGAMPGGPLSSDRPG